MTVVVWGPGSAVPNAHTLLYKRDDEAAFVQQAKANVAAGTTVYKVLPNGYPFLELLRLYLHHRADPTDAWLDGHSTIAADHLWLARNFVRLRQALKVWDDRGATAALAALDKKQALLHPDQVHFIDFCKGFVSRLMQPILWGSPLTLTPATSSKAKAWWLLRSDLSIEVDQLLQELRSHFPGPTPSVLQSTFHRWLTDLKTWLDTQLFVTKQADALREASALCHGLAHIHFGLRRYSLALLYCHRATDLLLFSECAAEGLVDFTANNGGGALKASHGIDSQVTILNCYDSLVANQKMLFGTQRKSAFKDLNAHRNLLLLTHHLGSVPSVTANAVLTDVTAELKAIGGAKWEASSKAVRRMFDLEVHEFFGLSIGLMGTLVAG